MKQRGERVMGWVVAGVLLGVTGAMAGALSPEKTLNRCQAEVRQEVAQFMENKLADLGRCLRTIAEEVVEKNAPDAAKAARECVRRFGNLSDRDAELRADIAEKCDPSQPTVTHTLADVLGTGVPGVAEPLHAANLGAYCASFGGMAASTAWRSGSTVWRRPASAPWTRPWR